MVASSTCAESTMAAPMSTLVPLMKFAAKAFKDFQGFSRIFKDFGFGVLNLGYVPLR